MDWSSITLANYYIFRGFTHNFLVQPFNLELRFLKVKVPHVNIDPLMAVFWIFPEDQKWAVPTQLAFGEILIAQ